MFNKNENGKLSVRCRKAKKYTVVTVTACITVVMATVFAMTAFAADSPIVSTSGFINKACLVFQALIILVGAGLGLFGIVNLVEAYGDGNPGAKSQGVKQLMAGIALVMVALILVPELKDMMSSASSVASE